MTAVNGRPLNDLTVQPSFFVYGDESNGQEGKKVDI